MDEIERFAKCLSDKKNTWPTMEELIQIKKQGKSSAGNRSLEEIFSREYLIPIIKQYFYAPEFMNQWQLSNEQVKKGLGVEGFKNCAGFGFTPCRPKRHLLTKNEIIKNSPPDSWFKPETKALDNRCCPDFALREPLPFNAVGEVKFFSKNSKDAAEKELYNAVRQAIFYLGAFSGEYQAAILILVDGSDSGFLHTAHETLLINMHGRLGAETGIYITVPNLSAATPKSGGLSMPPTDIIPKHAVA